MRFRHYGCVRFPEQRKANRDEEDLRFRSTTGELDRSKAADRETCMFRLKRSLRFRKGFISIHTFQRDNEGTHCRTTLLHVTNIVRSFEIAAFSASAACPNTIELHDEPSSKPNLRIRTLITLTTFHVKDKNATCGRLSNQSEI